MIMTNVEDEKVKELRAFIEDAKTKEHPESYLIAILHRAQDLFGYLDRSIMDEVATAMSIPSAHIWGVATFYHYFNLKPKGKHTISVCLGTACYVKGAEGVLDAIRDELKIGIGGTTEDKLFTLQEARCLGACGIAPVVMIDDKIYGELTPKKMTDIIKGIKKSEK